MYRLCDAFLLKTEARRIVSSGDLLLYNPSGAPSAISVQENVIKFSSFPGVLNKCLFYIHLLLLCLSESAAWFVSQNRDALITPAVDAPLRQRAAAEVLYRRSRIKTTRPQSARPTLACSNYEKTAVARFTLLICCTLVFDWNLAECELSPGDGRKFSPLNISLGRIQARRVIRHSEHTQQMGFLSAREISF
jgi:hypothetical protein